MPEGWVEIHFFYYCYFVAIHVQSSCRMLLHVVSIEYRSDDVTKIIFFEIMGYDVIFL